ncbi:MAG: hypothetical protein ACRDDF_04370 [Aeromonas sp.]
MIKSRKVTWESLASKAPSKIMNYRLYNEKCHRKVFNKIVDKFLDSEDFLMEKVMYKKLLNRHYYQVNNNILITIFQEITNEGLGEKLVGASIKIQPSSQLPLDNDMIKEKTKFCKGVR